jgi:sugar O-acyltransferase (sialic acid O-acetyltransferase NeuD family)
MIVIGAGGFAKQLIDELTIQDYLKGLCFFDDINGHEKLFLNQFPIISSEKDVIDSFNSSNEKFILAIGDPLVRQKYFIKISKLGGELFGIISNKAEISKYVEGIEVGVNILSGSIVECGVYIKEGTNINVNCSITHDSSIGRYCEIGPGVQICGEVKMGDNCIVGAGAIVLPNIKIGNNVVIGAGAVVHKDVSDSKVMAGVPVRQIR